MHWPCTSAISLLPNLLVQLLTNQSDAMCSSAWCSLTRSALSNHCSPFSCIIVCQGVFNTAIEVFSSGVVHEPVVADTADASVEPCGIACVAADVDAVGVIGVVIVVEREWWVC